MGELVNVDNCNRAETNRMFAALLERCGGLNRWHHDREFASLDHQPVIRRDEASFTATRNSLLELAKGIGGFDRAFGSREDVDPVRHLIGTAAGWGGLPETEAFYFGVNPDLPIGHYQLIAHEVPVDAFCSISVYNAAGFFAPNDRHGRP